MRRNHTKFQVYKSLTLSSSRSLNSNSSSSLLPTSFKARFPQLFDQYTPKNPKSSTDLQKARELISSVKLPKINFSLINQTQNEIAFPVASARLSTNTKLDSSPKLNSIYESIQNLEKTILSPKPLADSFTFKTKSDLNQISKEFFSAIRLNKEIKVLKMLKVKKNLVFIRDSVGKTPLHWAVIRNHLTIAQILINNGADVQAQDFVNRSVRHFAELSNNQEALNLIERFS